MINYLRRELKKVKFIKSAYDWFRTTSVNLACWQQGLDRKELEEIVPDITDQYSTSDVDNPYMLTKIRSMHAFQVSLMKRTFRNGWGVVDIGDSSGNHMLYLRSFFDVDYSVSVNLDRGAIKKIREKGLDAEYGTAEEFAESVKRVDYVTMFQTLEHLENPIGFLKKARENVKTNFFVITVPFLRKSRVGLHHLRDPNHPFFDGGTPEDIHYFELSPEDWKLIFKWTGWELVYEERYYQYIRYIPFVTSALRAYWTRFDFEGFYGVVLR